MRTRRLLTILFLLIPFFLYGESAPEYCLQADRSLIQGDAYAAIESYNEALLINPFYRDALSGLAEAYFELEEYDTALKYSESAALYYNEDARLLNLTGRILLGLSRQDRAESYFNQVLQRQPNNIDARLGLGELRVLQGRFSEARDLYGQALSLSPHSLRALVSMALILSGEGRYEEAEDYLSEALRYGSGNADVQYYASLFYLEQQDYVRAESAVNLCRRIWTEYPGIDALQGKILYLQGNPEAAIYYFQLALQRDRSDTLIWYLCGRAYWDIGDRESAQTCLENANRQGRKDETARIYLEDLALRYYEMGDPLRTTLSEMHRLMGNDWSAEYYYRRALAELRRSLQLDPFSIEARFEFARILDVAGEPYRSLEEMQLLFELGYQEQELLDLIEVHERLFEDTLAGRWGFLPEDCPVEGSQVSVFYNASTPVRHTGAESALAVYFVDHLLTNDRIETAGQAEPLPAEYSEAYRSAREADADYFLITDFLDSDESFTCLVELYRADTGMLVFSDRMIRRGSNPVTTAIIDAVEAIGSYLPSAGRVCKRQGNTLLVNLGTQNGIESGDVIDLYREDPESLSSVFEEPELLGRLRVEEVDGVFCEGPMEYYGLIDQVEEGCWAIEGEEALPPAPAGSTGSESEATGDQPVPVSDNEGLLRRLLRL